MHNQPRFLTEMRIKIFREAGHAFKIQQLEERRQKNHLLNNMSNHQKSSNRRNWLSAHLGDYFSGDADAILRHDYNMCALQFDGEWFVRIIKINILDEDNPPKQPRVIRRAILEALEPKPEQLPLNGFDAEEDTKSMIELGELKHGVIGYRVDHNGLLAGYIFAELDEFGNTPQNIYWIDLDSDDNTTSIISSPAFDPSNPSTTIKLKPEYEETKQHEDEA